MSHFKKRHQLRPGDMFVVPSIVGGVLNHDVHVVLDDKYEITFWRGTKTCIGDIAPSAEVMCV
jgi:hypothetical protein